MASIAVADIPLSDGHPCRVLCLGEYHAPDRVIDTPSFPLVPWTDEAQIPVFLDPPDRAGMPTARAPSIPDPRTKLGPAGVVLYGDQVDLHLDSVEADGGATDASANKEATGKEASARASFVAISPEDLLEFADYLNGVKILRR